MKNAVKAMEMICTVLSENAVTHKTCKKWYQRSQNKDFDFSGRQCLGQPQKLDDEELEQLLPKNFAQTEVCIINRSYSIMHVSSSMSIR